MTFDEFKHLVSEGLGIESGQLERATSFRDDLGLDSLSVINFLIKVEHRFKLKFEVENLWAMKNLGEIYDTFETALKRRG